MQHRIVALDGFRGLAVSTVILYHFCGLRGGWAGVDAFFVLSGFLITTILRSERHQPRFWSMFYMRRLTRIMPPFAILMLVAGLFLDIRWSAVWPFFAFFAANLAWIMKPELIGPLSVLWSLAVEEHFYFLWPGAVRIFGDRKLAWMLVATIALEPVARVVALSFLTRDWSVFYALTPFRLDGLALGSLLSLVLAYPRWRAAADRWLLPSSIGALVLCVVAFVAFHPARETNLFFFNALGYSLIGVSATLMLAWTVLRQESLLSKALSWKPLQLMGKISYGLYLYHLVIFWIMLDLAKKIGFDHPKQVMFLSAPVSFWAAWLSFRYLESPILNFGRRRVATFRMPRSLVTQ